MADYVAYGFDNTNRRDIDIKNTLAYKQLKVFSANRIVVDVHWHSAERKELQKLIDELDEDSVIYMYSVDTLLKGKNKGVEYYKQILDKGIGLLVFDHSGDLPKVSPISTFPLIGDKNKDKKQKSPDEQKAEYLEIMKRIASEYTPIPMTGKTTHTAIFSKEFRELYFMYEAYLINEKTLMKYLPERLGISNKQTFISLCREYEKSIPYLSDFEYYCDCDDKFLTLPKRTGKLPREYNDIMTLAEQQQGTETERIQKALNLMNIYSNASVILRWKLAKEKVPKPRKSDGRKVETYFTD